MSLGETFNNLGLTFTSIDSLEKALVFYKKSLHLKGLKGKTVSYAKTLNNIGLVEQRLGNYQLAKSNFDEAILVAEQANNLYQVASININLLDLMLDQKEVLCQDDILKDLENIILTNHFNDLKPRLFLLKSNFAFNQKNYQKAIDY